MCTKKSFAFNGWLTAAVAVVMLANVLVRALRPEMMLRPLGIPGITAIVLTALLAESFGKKTGEHCLVLQPILAAIAFGVLTGAAGVVAWAEVWKVAVVGGVVSLIAIFVFDSIVERVDSGLTGRIALVMTTFVLFLASQCFAGMIL